VENEHMVTEMGWSCTRKSQPAHKAQRKAIGGMPMTKKEIVVAQKQIE